jgi:hypothetical protein
MNRRVLVLLNSESSDQMRDMVRWLAKWRSKMIFIDEVDGDKLGTHTYRLVGPEEAIIDLPTGAAILGEKSDDPERN